LSHKVISEFVSTTFFSFSFCPSLKFKKKKNLKKDVYCARQKRFTPNVQRREIVVIDEIKMFKLNWLFDEVNVKLVGFLKQKLFKVQKDRQEKC